MDTNPTSKTVTEHELKVASEFFDAVESGQKPFEIRKGDRPFKVGDTLWLREVDIVLAYTGREARKRITFVLRGWGMESGYVALGLSPSPDETTAPLTAASLDTLIAEADKYILPVDVKIGAATFRKGVKVGTMLRGLKSHAERQTATAYSPAEPTPPHPGPSIEKAFVNSPRRVETVSEERCKCGQRGCSQCGEDPSAYGFGPL